MSAADKLGEQFQQHIESFAAADRDAARWRTTDTGEEIERDCASISRAFADHLNARGIKAHVVEGDKSTNPWVWSHRWTRVEHEGQHVNIDWTARQMRTIDYPRNPAHARQNSVGALDDHPVREPEPAPGHRAPAV